MPWATAEQTNTLTGYTPTEAQLNQAQAIIELFAGTTEDATDAGLVGSRDLRRLRSAVAYQATWIRHHPDIFIGQDVDSVSHDGVSAQYSHANARLLAPFAKRHIDRLSWKQKGLRARPFRGSRADPGSYGNRDSAARDDYRSWTPL